MSSLFSIMSIDPLRKKVVTNSAEPRVSKRYSQTFNNIIISISYLHDNEKMKSRMYLCFRIEQINLGQNIDVEDLRVSCSIY